MEDLSGNGGRPRSLEFGEGIEAKPLKSNPEEADFKLSGNEKLQEGTSVEEDKSRKKRSPTDANGNKILSIVERSRK